MFGTKGVPHLPPDKALVAVYYSLDAAPGGRMRLGGRFSEKASPPNCMEVYPEEGVYGGVYGTGSRDMDIVFIASSAELGFRPCYSITRIEYI